MDIETIRADTPLTRSTSYFNTAAASLPPEPVLEAVCGYLLDTSRIGICQPAFRRLTQARVEGVRGLLAHFLNVEASELAFTPNATEAIATVARGLAWRPGDEVLVADTEPPGNFLPWKRLEATHGVIVRVVPSDREGLLTAGAFADLVTPRTRLLTFSHLSASSGALQDASAICAMARGHDVLTLVDAAQSLGLVATDVAATGCDFLAGCGRKGLRTTEGVGFLYVNRERILGPLPTLPGWWKGTYDPTTGQMVPFPGARRFEAGAPAVAAVLGLGKAVDYARAIGIDEIERRVRELTRRAIKRFADIPGIDLSGPLDPGRRVGILSFGLPGKDPDALTSAMETQGCILDTVDPTPGSRSTRPREKVRVRLALHYFNTREEIDSAAALLRSLGAG